MKFGPFWLEARLAVGGTAEVYVARPIDAAAQPRKLVVKRLLPHFVADPEGRTMFEREAALHAAVRHDNVVEVYGSGLHGDEPWLAMEWVDGCDLFRLLRRLANASRTLGRGISVYAARELLRALESVHTARDGAGQPMVIIHRDVTPSNIYLSADGRVKLGDFGIARSANRSTLSTTGGPVLKGKFAYLAPEQVASEGFDQRADLFATAVVLAEMLLGRPLFAGSGQLAVLLAIRDCRIDPLRDARASLPEGLFEVLERALARSPANRFQTAAALSDALAPFDSNPAAARAELGALVRWVQSAPSAGQMQAVRDSGAKLRAAAVARNLAADSARDAADDTEEIEDIDIETEGVETGADLDRTGEYAQIPSFVTTGAGDRLGPWPFARLIEAIATGDVGRGDRVEFMGREPALLGSITELARFLPALTAATTNRMAGVGVPDFVDSVSAAALVTVLVNVIESETTGVLFAEGPTESRRVLAQATGYSGRKELYFVAGKLAHIASSNASELLGEYLVRRGVITRVELDFALAVLPRYGGRMGDTLASLGLLPSVDVFRAIRDQGRDRLIDLFQWRTGTLTFYKDQTAPHIEFPLELELPSLILAGLEAAEPGDATVVAWRDRLDEVIVPAPVARPRVHAAPWPELVRRVLDWVDRPRRVRAVLEMASADGATLASDGLRAIEVLLAAKLLARDVSA
ncbi:MAG TPA: serine/threonine-protein kinase [Polyangiaceae bacterium]|nr:serine/threonine-protein kinase [Polyangiaceae bacterium]